MTTRVQTPDSMRCAFLLGQIQIRSSLCVATKLIIYFMLLMVSFQWLWMDFSRLEPFDMRDDLNCFRESCDK